MVSKEELLLALELALDTLNQMPKAKLNGVRNNSYKVASILNKVITKAKGN